MLSFSGIYRRVVLCELTFRKNVSSPSSRSETAQQETSVQQVDHVSSHRDYTTLYPRRWQHSQLPPREPQLLHNFTLLVSCSHIVYQRPVATRLCNGRMVRPNYKILQRQQTGLFQATALLLRAESS
jgi:hypothetical protein